MMFYMQYHTILLVHIEYSFAGNHYEIQGIWKELAACKNT